MLTYAELSFSYLDHHSHGGFLAGLRAHSSQHSALLMFLITQHSVQQKLNPLVKRTGASMSEQEERGSLRIYEFVSSVIVLGDSGKERGSCSVVTC